MDEERPGPGWLVDDDDPEPAGTGRRWILPVLAVVPWTVVLAVILRSAPDPAPGIAPAAQVPSPTAVATASEPPEAVVRAAAPTSPMEEPSQADATIVASDARLVPRLGDAAAIATVVARSWLTGVGPTIEVGAEATGDRADRYAEHLVVEAVDHPAPGHAVVTLLAVLLHRRGDVYDGVEVRRLAVPVTLDAGGAAPAGTPWWLADPQMEVRPPALVPIADEQLLVEAGAAVTSAGYRDVEVRSLARTGGWPLVVTVRGVAPDDHVGGEHVLWLRRHLGGFVVAGDLPRTATSGADRPTEEDTP